MMGCLTAVLAHNAGLQAALIFSADFDNGTSGAVDAIGDLGAPSVGTFTTDNVVSGAATYGFITNAASGDKAFTSGNDANTRMTVLGAGISTFEASPSTSFRGVAPTNRMYANFAAADITGGLGATVQFDTGAFGTQNLGAVKGLIVRGLSSVGDEVFETLITHGSGSGTRRIYAREVGDSTYTRSGTSAGAPQGTQVFTSIDAWNGTNNTVEPANLNTLTITIQNGFVTYASESGTAGGTLSFAQNSGATDIAQLEFTSWNNNQGGNSGYWLDDVSVNTIPEPSSTALLGLGGLALILRRRR
ncbi:MAG: PEP-CTERM sorting domain-containing protein [Akkermansiaceae bacterium]